MTGDGTAAAYNGDYVLQSGNSSDTTGIWYNSSIGKYLWYSPMGMWFIDSNMSAEYPGMADVLFSDNGAPNTWSNHASDTSPQNYATYSNESSLGGSGTISVTSCATSSYNGTYSAYNMSGYGGTQTYTNGTAYIFRLEDDESVIYWCINSSIIETYAQPGTPSQYYVQNAATTIPTTGWQNCTVTQN